MGLTGIYEGVWSPFSEGYAHTHQPPPYLTLHLDLSRCTDHLFEGLFHDDPRKLNLLCTVGDEYAVMNGECPNASSLQAKEHANDDLALGMHEAQTAGR